MAGSRQHAGHDGTGKQHSTHGQAQQPQSRPPSADMGSATIPGWNLQPDDMVALQRSMGNRAVQRMLKAGASRQPATAQRQPAPPHQARPSGSLVVQRKIGFELESGSWNPWVVQAQQTKKRWFKKNYQMYKLRSATRKEKLHVDPSGLFTLEGDDTQGANKPDIEFVTKAFPVSEAGVADMDNAFKDIKAITGRIEHYTGQADGDPPGAGYPFYKPAQLTNNFVGPTQHQLSKTNVYFSQIEAANTAKFKLQATQGLSLEEVEPMMNILGSKEGRTFMLGESKLKDGDEGIFKILGGVSGLVDVAIDYLKNKDVLDDKEQAPALRGFLSSTIMYVKALSSESLGIKNAKYFIPLLARTNLAKQFELVPERKLLTAELLAKAIVRGANSTRYIETGNSDKDFTTGSPVIRSQLLGLTKVSIQDWVSGIVDGGVDYLNATTIDGLLSQKKASNLEKGQAKNALESFSALGDDPYSDKTDKADVPLHTRMAIFENRFINRYMTIDEAAQAAAQYMEMLKGFKESYTKKKKKTKK